MDFRITTLVDNSVPLGGGKLIGEHGLSLYVEAGDQKILFDTGSNVALAHNANLLGIDLGGIDRVVLSHGHYDHTGGLKYLLEKNAAFTLHAHPDVFDDKLRSADKGTYKKIGIPLDRKVFENRSIQMRLGSAQFDIAPGIFSTGEIPLKNDFEFVESIFFVQRHEKISPDAMADDQALVLDTRRGLAVLLGCSHRGVINTLDRVCNIAGKDKIYAIMGGLHLGKASGAKLAKIMDHLSEFNPEQIGVGHCTGTRAMLALFDRFNDRVFVNSVGTVKVF
jgi:7,8-dihydropterin-6-yl-methyl-4-(beta-D-ribofuranosyl)aminobenzene 5'-phosphate synthase